MSATFVYFTIGKICPSVLWEEGAAAWVGRVVHGPPKILIGWIYGFFLHLAPPIIGLYVR